MALHSIVADTAPATPTVLPSPAKPARDRRGVRLGRWSELLLVVGLGLLALLIRWPNFELIPAFTDETNDLRRGLLVTQGQLAPLTAGATYVGSLWIWLIALALPLGSFDPSVPRVLVLAFGVATVLATYLLGRSWGGRLGGALAAVLLATAAGHVVVNSHVGWSNCITPFFTTLGVWALSRALGPNPPAPFPSREGGVGADPVLTNSPAQKREQDQSRYATSPPSRDGKGAGGLGLLLAGLCWGLAFQTHPTTVALLPAVAGYFLWHGRASLRTRWPYLAAGLFLLANLNLLLYNVSSGFASVERADEIMDDYNKDEAFTPALYLERVDELLLNLLKLTGGAVDGRDTRSAYWFDPGLWPISLLALGGLALHWRRGNPLPGLLVLSTVLVLPLFTRKFDLLLSGRYYAPLLPVLLAAAATLITVGFGALSRAGTLRSRSRASGCLALVLVTGFVVLHPLGNLAARYAADWRAGSTNEQFFRTVQLLQAHRTADEPVLVDDALYESRLTSVAGRTARTLGVLLDVARIPFRAVDFESRELRDPRNRCRDQLAIVDLQDPERRTKVVRQLALRPLDDQPPPSGADQRFAVYRLDRLPDAPACT